MVGAPGIWLTGDSDSDLEDKDNNSVTDHHVQQVMLTGWVQVGRQLGGYNQDLMEGSVLETFAGSLRKRPLPHHWRTEAGIH